MTRIVAVCALSLLLVDGVTNAQQARPQTAAEFRSTGDQSFERNGFRDAIEAYENAARLGLRNDARMVLRLAISYNEVGEFDNAAAVADAAITLDPTSAAAHYEHGYAQKGLGDRQPAGTPAEKQQYDAAIASFLEAIRLNPSHGRAFQGLGETYYARGAESDAATAYARAVTLIPDDDDLRVSLGNIYSSLDARDQDAAVQYAEAVRLDSENYDARTSLAQIYRRLDRLPESLEHLRAALRIKPDYARAHAQLALTLTKQGNKTGALDEFRIAERLDKALAEPYMLLLEDSGVNVRAAAGTTSSPPSACPELGVDGPIDVFSGQPITFKARVTGATAPSAPAFNWRVSAATIVSGQGTATITVDTAGMSGQTTTATVEVRGLSSACELRSAVRTRILGRGKQ